MYCEYYMNTITNINLLQKHSDNPEHKIVIMCTCQAEIHAVVTC